MGNEMLAAIIAAYEEARAQVLPAWEVLKSCRCR